MNKNLDKTDKTRVNIYIPTFLVKKVEKYATDMGLNKSSAYSVIIKQFFDYQDGINSIPDLLDVVKKLDFEVKGN